MRFHCGISFSWRTIKKFLFPFLIGVLGVLGFNYIFENKDNLPFKWLTFTTPVYAAENYDTNYDYISSIQPSPDDPDEPILVHKGFFNKVYWFDDNSTSLGVLSNIYELLFFYCISVLLIKALSFIKNSGGKK